MTRHVVQESDAAPDGRRTAAAALRNVAPLIEALRAHLPAEGRVLEIASGTGQHAAAFAAAYPALRWTPSDPDPGQRASIAAWRRAAGLGNLDAPLELDVADAWPIGRGEAQAVLAVNLLHLVPAPFVARLFDGARAALSEGGRALVYGPFLRGEAYASDGDRAFDAALRGRDPAIGYKSVESVCAAALAAGLAPVGRDAMPANNLLLSFRAT